MGLAAPFAWQASRLVGHAQTQRPLRVFIYYVPHGWPIEHVDPDLSAPALADSTVLSPLAAYQDRTRVVRGVRMNDGATNHAAIRAVLTGFSEGGSASSIDAVLAEAMGVAPHVLGAIPWAEHAGFTVDSQLVRHAGSWVRPTEDPRQAAQLLLGNLGTGGTEPAGDDNAFRQATLSFTEGELEAVQARVAGLTRESNRLTQHLSAVRALKAAQDQAPVQTACDARPPLPAVDALAGADVLDQTNMAAVLDAHLEVTSHAMRCGSARVVTLQNMWVNGDLRMDFPSGPGIAKGHHEPISHSWDAAGRAEFAQCQRWFLERLATGLLAPLDVSDPLDPEHTVLDNSLVYVCSEVSDGANHHSDNSPMWLDGREMGTYLPTLLIGGGAGRMASGGWVDVDAPHTDVLATLAAVAGVSMTSHGGQSVAPLAGVLA